MKKIFLIVFMFIYTTNLFGDYFYDKMSKSSEDFSNCVIDYIVTLNVSKLKDNDLLERYDFFNNNWNIVTTKDCKKYYNPFIISKILYMENFAKENNIKNDKDIKEQRTIMMNNIHKMSRYNFIYLVGVHKGNKLKEKNEKSK